MTVDSLADLLRGLGASQAPRSQRQYVLVPTRNTSLTEDPAAISAALNDVHAQQVADGTVQVRAFWVVAGGQWVAGVGARCSTGAGAGCL